MRYFAFSDEVTFQLDVGTFKRIEFNPENSTHFILMSDSHMVFMTWVRIIVNEIFMFPYTCSSIPESPNIH
jgi:hypothetical protein